MTEFHAAGWFEVAGIGWEASGTLDRDTTDFSHLMQRRVLIDGHGYVCIAVNHFRHAPPWRRGERVGLVVTARQAAISRH